MNNLIRTVPNDIYAGTSFTCTNTVAIIDPAQYAGTCSGSASDPVCPATPGPPVPSGCNPSNRAYASTSPSGKVAPSDFFTYV